MRSDTPPRSTTAGGDWPNAFLPAVVLALLPAFALGVFAAELMRRRRLHWSWALFGVPVTLPIAVVLFPPRVRAIAEHSPTLADYLGVV